MSYFTALVVRLGLYFYASPYPSERRGATKNSIRRKNSAALRKDH